MPKDVKEKGHKRNTDENKVLYESVSEDVRPTGEKIPVAKDSRTVKDDIKDYVYLKPRRKKKKHKHKHGHGHSHSHRHKRQRKKTIKRIILGVVCGILAAVIACAGTLFYLLQKGKEELFNTEFHVTAPQGVTVNDGGKLVEYDGHTYALNENITSMLFMGVDKRDLDDNAEVGEGQGQADVIVVGAYDAKNRKITLINVPRDTMTDVSIYSSSGAYAGTKRQQICLAYSYGSDNVHASENTVSAVAKLFYNIPVNTYFTMDMNGISALNDSVGGVDVTSPETIGSFVEGQEYHLTGAQAESFVRDRSHKDAEANLRRNERQKVYVASFMNKVFSSAKKDPGSMIGLFNASSPFSTTNITPAKVAYLAQDISSNGAPKTDQVSIDGTTTLKGNHAEFTVDEESFYELFLSVYYEIVS